MHQSLLTHSTAQLPNMKYYSFKTNPKCKMMQIGECRSRFHHGYLQTGGLHMVELIERQQEVRLPQSTTQVLQSSTSGVSA